MTDVAMAEAAFFQLQAAAGGVDTTSVPQLALCVSVLGNAIEAAISGVNASLVNDIEFAVNDLGAAIDELSQADASTLAPLLAVLREAVDALKTATSLDPDVVARIRALQSKLKERLKAIERQTYVEGGASGPLPHDPALLRDEAIPLGRLLLAAGFATPALDALIAEPESLRFHSIREILDELEVIAG